ncbi:MAG: hypothetical protein JRI25_22990 [Deltaproteobacteria bacterium]|nr:hypothetical protein [Deltaproteobacteria bacterium]
MGVVDLELQYVADIEVDLDVVLKQDPDLGSGRLEVDLVYAGTADGDTELKRAMEQAIGVWRDLYDQIGIALSVAERGWESDGDIAAPGFGSGELYEAISDSAPLGSVVVVVVDEFEDGEGIYGVAGGIPGPLVGSERSVVAVNAITNSGPDLVFSEEEERLLGETMAHEVLHYLGLFHPVEPDWAQWDALEDTAGGHSRVQHPAVLYPGLGRKPDVPVPDLRSDRLRAPGPADRSTGWDRQPVYGGGVMWVFLLAALGLAVAGSPEEEVSAALLPRHGQASCSDLAARVDGDVLTNALIRVAEGVEHPPWVPMRAARCVADAAAEDPTALRAAEAWLHDERRPGLALVVVQRLDRLDGKVAATLADLAVARGQGDPRFAVYARAALLRSRHPELAGRAAGLSNPENSR